MCFAEPVYGNDEERAHALKYDGKAIDNDGDDCASKKVTQIDKTCFNTFFLFFQMGEGLMPTALYNELLR